MYRPSYSNLDLWIWIRGQQNINVGWWALWKLKKKKIKKWKKRKEDSEEIMEESLAVLDVKPSNIDSLG